MNPSRKSRNKKKKRKPHEPNGGATAVKEDNDDSGSSRIDASSSSSSRTSSSSPSSSSSSSSSSPSSSPSLDHDSNRAAEILSAGSSLDDDDGNALLVLLRKEELPKGRKQRSFATSSTGLVSSVLGKAYLGSTRKDSSKSKGPRISNDEAEDFLCSMLGYESQLNMGVIRDVFCQCGYDVEKALDTLLEMSASSYDQFVESDHSSSGRTDGLDIGIFPVRNRDHLADSIKRKCQLTEDSIFPPSEKEFHEDFESAGQFCGDCTTLGSISEEHSSFTSGTMKSYLPQKVLESLFNIPESSERKPDSMDWKKVIKTMESFGQGLEFRSSSTAKPQQSTRHEDDYQLFRRSARKHWDTTVSYYQKAAAAYSRGERGHAAYLSEKGKLYNRKACEADEKASQDIFEARNKEIQNVVTIDLHGQHVKQAIRLLKLHLILFTYIPSIQFLNVITGCGTHGGVGKGKLKQSVICLIEKEGIEWSEGNKGTVVIRLNGLKEFSFLQSDSDSE
ncbi:SMR domain-containing protein At5g58720 isoform X2 [Magnolia sinica]|uniref:SMR domain-containing protein At5g58720 isoform X2 n=1 Tax=Magnolia sinica TaxID=86752 RepID=UPI00265A8688|nr:SMR domain-containing protein At5g58720 isoform X2 [Magnolia sinica]